MVCGSQRLRSCARAGYCQRTQLDGLGLILTGFEVFHEISKTRKTISDVKVAVRARRVLAIRRKNGRD